MKAARLPWARSTLTVRERIAYAAAVASSVREARAGKAARARYRANLRSLRGLDGRVTSAVHSRP